MFIHAYTASYIRHWKIFQSVYKKPSKKNQQRMDKAIAKYHGEYRSSCGYCNSSGSKVSRGMHLYQCPVQVYEQLWERNWRRCGAFYYQPCNDVICCPQYAIRCKAPTFQPSKHHEKVLRKFDKWLKHEWEPKEKEDSEQKQIEMNKSKRQKLEQNSVTIIQNYLADLMKQVMEHLENEVGQEDILVDLFAEEQFPISVHNKQSQKKKKNKELKDNVSTFSCNIAIVLMGHAKKNQLKGIDKQTSQNLALKIVNHLEKMNIAHDYIDSVQKLYAKHGFVNFDIISSNLQNEDYTQKNANNSHKETNSRIFRTEIFESTFRKEEFDLYVRYQVHIHGDDPLSLTPEGYTRFLCNSSLLEQNSTQLNRELPLSGYGTYHIQYWVDNHLIAVSVVDVLEKGLSSVYFFYDPDYSFLSLGVYSALFELDMIKKENVKCPEFKYYYLGYYIHSCQKMRYKAQYQPSELLCPVTYKWAPASVAISKLERQKFCKLYDGEDEQDEEAVDLTNLYVLYNKSIYTLESLKAELGLEPTKSQLKLMKEFLKCCGKASTRILYSIDSYSLMRVNRYL